MHHYTESGLDNVWLKNGYIVKQTPYGKAVAVVDADSLHKLLAVWLTRKEGRLSGKEFRYLRGVLCLSQLNTARMLGVTGKSCLNCSTAARKSAISRRSNPKNSLSDDVHCGAWQSIPMAKEVFSFWPRMAALP